MGPDAYYDEAQTFARLAGWTRLGHTSGDALDFDGSWRDPLPRTASCTFDVKDMDPELFKLLYGMDITVSNYDHEGLALPRPITILQLRKGDTIRARFELGGVRQEREGVFDYAIGRIDGLDLYTVQGAVLAPSGAKPAITLLDRPKPKPKLPTGPGSLILASGTDLGRLFENEVLLLSDARQGGYWVGAERDIDLSLPGDSITKFEELALVKKADLDALRTVSRFGPLYSRPAVDGKIDTLLGGADQVAGVAA